MSPRNLYIADVVLSVVFPDAPSQTRAGNVRMAHAASYSPFIHDVSCPLYVSRLMRRLQKYDNNSFQSSGFLYFCMIVPRHASGEIPSPWSLTFRR